MLGAEKYPITIVEMGTYQDDADHLFTGDDHDSLKDFLALHPENGDLVAGTGGVRQLLWSTNRKEENCEAQIIYYFRDLNMPLYLLAIFPAGDWIEFDDEWRLEIAKVVSELIEQHSKQWARVSVRPDSGA